MNPVRRNQFPASVRRFAKVAVPVVGLSVAFLAAFFGAASARLSPAKQLGDSSLVVHEWGTFTSIAGVDGAAVEWLPVSPRSDLPAFVEHNSSAIAKGGLRGTIRMETPVIYFYSPRQRTVSVHVSFAKGLITEWFPHATQVRPSSSGPVALNPKVNGSVDWKDVTIEPASNQTFPRENAPSHYYAARETSASPISVATASGAQLEKFLFYRGVSAFSPPLSAKVLVNGQLQIQSHAGAIPTLILFERRGDKLGYTISSLKTSATLNTPSTSGTFDSLRIDFEDALVAQGLYRDEARAMLETWRDSWFEEGSRLFYIVPRSFVDSVLPLSIHPAPTQLTRVFVGRIELVTPATENAVETALLARDHETLQKYDRFLAPIVDIILAKRIESGQATRLRQALPSYYSWLYTPPASRR